MVNIKKYLKKDGKNYCMKCLKQGKPEEESLDKGHPEYHNKVHPVLVKPHKLHDRRLVR
jgi:hypothetical protein